MFDINFFIDWIINDLEPKIRIGQIRGNYTDFVGNDVTALYGVSDMAIIFYTINSLFLNDHEKMLWVKLLKKFQNINTGYFSEYKQNHHILHNTAFAISALNLFGEKPKYSLKFITNFDSKKKLELFLNNFDWESEVYKNSHKAAGLASSVALVPETINYEWFEWFFEICDKFFDQNHGMMGNNSSKEVNFDQIGGTFHYFFIYEYFRKKIKYSNQRIDSILKIQNSNGSWSREPNIWWLNLDAVYMLTRSVKNTGYRIKDIKKALIKNMEFVMNRINNENLRVEDFEKCVHNLTGAINCLAELQLFLGRDLVYSKQPLLSVLDKRPFI
jgi:hypothetical protein